MAALMLGLCGCMEGPVASPEVTAVPTATASPSPSPAPTAVPTAEPTPTPAPPPPLPEGFVRVEGVRLSMNYAGADNLVGRPLEGYERPVAILLEEAAQALLAAQAEAEADGLSLLIYDAYRPQRAVDDLERWAQDMGDQVRKAENYPDVDKADLFDLGYIARRSNHSRGIAVDLTIVDAATGAAWDMGTRFDFLGEASWHSYRNGTEAQRENRAYLKKLMERHGFAAYDKEWWHYALRDAPTEKVYYDFLVE